MEIGTILVLMDIFLQTATWATIGLIPEVSGKKAGTKKVIDK